MRIERGEADRAQEAAFRNRDVATIVKRVLLFADDARLIRIAYEAVISFVPASRETLQARLGGVTADPDLVDAALEIAEAGARIEAAGNGENDLRRGALLERLVFSLVGLRRAAEVSRETYIFLTVGQHSGKGRTGRKDVVVDADPFEVYECKFGAAIEQWELDLLGDVYLTAEAEGSAARPCIATMGDMSQLQRRFASRGLIPHAKLYFAGLGDLHRLAISPPSQQVA